MNKYSYFSFLVLFSIAIYQCVTFGFALKYLQVLEKNCFSSLVSTSLPLWCIISCAVGVVVDFFYLVAYYRPAFKGDRGADPIGLGYLRNTTIVCGASILPILFRLAWLVVGVVILSSIDKQNCKKDEIYTLYPLSVAVIATYPIACICKITLFVYETPYVW